MLHFEIQEDCERRIHDDGHAHLQKVSSSITLFAFPAILITVVAGIFLVPPNTHHGSLDNGLEVAARLNKRYATGRPSNILEEAGILIHVYDGYDNVYPESHSFPDIRALWDPGLRCDIALSNAAFFRSCDRVSASLLNAQMSTSATGTTEESQDPAGQRVPASQRDPQMLRGSEAGLYGSAPGIVLAPKPTAPYLLCSYPTDGGSDGAVCDVPGGGEQCRPGCFNVNKCHCYAEGSQVFGDSQTSFPHGFLFVDECKVPINPAWGPTKAICSFGPNRLDVMMQKQQDLLDRGSTPRWLEGPRKSVSFQSDAYTWGLASPWNEVMLSTLNPSWSEDMIEALFIQDSSPCNSQRLAHIIHGAMLKAGLKVPLLGYNNESPQPFTANPMSSYCWESTSLSSSSVVIACSIFAFISQRLRPQDASHVVLSMISMTMFGVSNFLMGQAGNYLLSPLAHVHVMFIMTGCMAYLVHITLWYAIAEYRSSWSTAMASPVSVKLLAVASGLMIAVAQVCACIGFQRDSSYSGANHALTCLSFVMVSLFFYFHRGEKLSRIQVWSYISILFGSLIIAGLAFHLRVPEAVAWSCFSALCYGISTITLRLSSTAGVSSVVRMEVLYLVLGTVALVLLPVLGPSQGVHEFLYRPAALLWPFLNACAEFLGLWCVICAYDLPGTNVAVVTAVVDSNYIVTLLMNFVSVGVHPGYDRMAGVLLILLGQATIHEKHFFGSLKTLGAGHD